MRFLLLFLIYFASLTASAQTSDTNVCHIGFTYNISLNKHWGYGKPIITHVSPYTSAEQAGLKTGDIIETIDGIPTQELTSDMLPLLFNSAEKDNTMLTVRGFGQQRTMLIKRTCKPQKAITEDQLATAFAFYSLETTTNRSFTCPFTTKITADSVDFSTFHTFAFSALDPNNSQLESNINAFIQTNLEKKGLLMENEDPDILIQTYYFFDKNPNFTKTNKVSINKEATYRFNGISNRMEAFPFLPSSAAEADAPYLLQLGIRLIDKKTATDRILWECEANELLQEAYDLSIYAGIHIPLMFEQFPCVKHSRNVRFVLNQQAYNYTGISYDIDNLSHVIDVAPNSPAWEAGIRKGDIIEKIGNHKLKYTAEEYTMAYKSFISATMKLRNPASIYTDMNGFRRCMYWDKEKYFEVAKTISKPKYRAPFSYLFAYAPYIQHDTNNICSFKLIKADTDWTLMLRPSLRTAVSLTVE